MSLRYRPEPAAARGESDHRPSPPQETGAGVAVAPSGHAGPSGAAARREPSRATIARRSALAGVLGRLIAAIDELVADQLNEVLHHPDFQALEASWRAVADLVERAAAAPRRDVLVRVLNASWKDLTRDARRASEWDQSALFHLIYEQEYGMPGGIPFGVIIGDFEIGLQDRTGQGLTDLEVLESISRAAAAAFTPFICGADPALLGLARFAQLERRPNLKRIMSGPAYARWRSMRAQEDSRFAALTAPRVLRRLPYRGHCVALTMRRCGGCGALVGREEAGACPGCRRELSARGVVVERHGFRFTERVDRPDGSQYLWGNAAFALAGVLMRSFAASSWLADIRGITRDTERGGMVTGQPVDSFGVDRDELSAKMSTDVAIEDRQERELADVGIIPLCQCHLTSMCAFYSNQSLYEAAAGGGGRDAKLSAMLQYTFCVSRIAHYLKLLARDRIGSVGTADQLERELGNWVNGYVTQDDLAAPEIKARYPLREATVRVRETPGRPGVFQCAMQLMPHYELDEMAIGVRLITPLEGARGA
jgi:type VI secretion system protein ImpD